MKWEESETDRFFQIVWKAVALEEGVRLWIFSYR